jgi:Mce-associated membrane protein
VKTFVIALLGVLVVVAAVLVPTMWVNLRDQRDADAAGRAALAVAKEVAPDLLSYDYRTVEEDLARAGTHTTGELTKHYKELATTLVSKAKAQKIVQTVAIAGAGIEREEPGRVDVLLFVNTGTVKEIPGKDGPEQQFTQNRARFVMVRQDSHWLVADLSTLLGSA